MNSLKDIKNNIKKDPSAAILAVFVMIGVGVIATIAACAPNDRQFCRTAAARTLEKYANCRADASCKLSANELQNESYLKQYCSERDNL